MPCPGSTVLACWGGTLRHFLSPTASDPCGQVPGACIREVLGEGRCGEEEAFSARGHAEPTGLEEGAVNLASELSTGVFCRSGSAGVCCELRAGSEALGPPRGSLEGTLLHTGEVQWEDCSRIEEIWAGTESMDSPY